MLEFLYSYNLIYTEKSAAVAIGPMWSEIPPLGDDFVAFGGVGPRGA